MNEEVYVVQPNGFEDAHYLNHIYKLKRALYGLKQAPRAWQERITEFLTKKGYVRESIQDTIREEGESKYYYFSDLC